MPNWVRHEVEFTIGNSLVSTNNPKLWDAIKAYVQTQPHNLEPEPISEFDFDSIVPQPKDIMDIRKDPIKDNAASLYYQMPYWYEWRCDNWGTKWNASDPYVGDSVVTFDTAWANAEPVIKALSEKFPEVTITVKFADEDLGGGNNGCYSYTNGEVSYIDDGSYEFACELWGYEPEDTDEETAMWDHLADIITTNTEVSNANGN
jgi:hypothetical protein